MSKLKLEQLLAPRQLASLSGFHTATIYLEVKRGHLRALRLAGNRLRFRPADVDRWLRRRGRGSGDAR